MRTVPDWSIQAAWWASGIFATGAVWYFLSTREYPLAVAATIAAAALAGVAIILHRKKDAVQASLPHSVIATETTLSKITVKEIVEAINAAPPFQKDQIAKQYNGIKVKWTGYLKEAKEDYRDKESVRVNLNVERDEIVGYSFWFTVKVAKIPEIRALKRKSAICVVGEIVSASGEGLCVDLKPNTVEVVEHYA
jgi:hypothetical protein